MHTYYLSKDGKEAFGSIETDLDLRANDIINFDAVGPDNIYATTKYRVVERRLNLGFGTFDRKVGFIELIVMEAY
jgi:hypothetical protein